MNLVDQLQKHQERVSIIGLGYVGLPLAIELAETYDAVGFDIDDEKLEKSNQRKNRLFVKQKLLSPYNL